LLKDSAQKVNSFLETKSLNSANMPILSNLTGAWADQTEMSNAEYWRDQILNPVKFLNMATKINKLENSIILEIGPDSILSTLIKSVPEYRSSNLILNTLTNETQKDQEIPQFYSLLGSLWRTGLPINFSLFFNNENRSIISDYYYSFEKNEIEKNNQIDSSENQLNTIKTSSKIEKKEILDISAIKELWLLALGYDDINYDEDFFSLGGNSLIAAEIATEINKRSNINLNPSIMYQYSTLSQFGNYINECNIDINKEKIIALKKNISNFPKELSSQQERLWFLHKYNPESANYNLVHTLSINGKIDIELLKESIHIFLSRHEVFYSSISENQGVPYLSLTEKMLVPIIIKEVKNNSDFQQELSKEVCVPYNFSDYPISKVIIYQISSILHYSVLYVPHIFSDGWSAEIYRKEIREIYKCLMNKDELNLPSLPLQYSDYSQWEKEQSQRDNSEKSTGFWKEYLAEIPSEHHLPLDFTRPDELSGKGDVIEFSINRENSQLIRLFCKDNKITPFVFFLAVISVRLFSSS